MVEREVGVPPFMKLGSDGKVLNPGRNGCKVKVESRESYSERGYEPDFD